MRDLVEIGPRVSGTPANVKTRQYITTTLASIGIKAIEQPFEAKTPLGPVKMANIVATLPGARPDRIVIGSHFDTKLFKEFRFVGASEWAALLHQARMEPLAIGFWRFVPAGDMPRWAAVAMRALDAVGSAVSVSSFRGGCYVKAVKR